MKYAVALGNFDGVHRAHTELIKSLVQYARSNNMKSAIYTFDRHPKALLCPKGIKLITQNEVKKEIILSLGVDEIYFEPLTSGLLNTAPEVFIRDILLKRFNVCAVFAGYDYRFGMQGSASVNELKAFGEKYGFETMITDEIKYKGTTVSSSNVRRALNEGNITLTNELLGRTYALRGRVVYGKRLGRKIGFPTLNIEIPSNLLPPKTGVYVSKTKYGGALYQSITNIGSNPTVENAPVRSETHVFGFDQNIYGEEAEIQLFARVRDEKKFHSVDELRAQIAMDIAFAKEYFSQNLKK